MTIRLIEHHEQAQMLQLRHQVLRQPIGLSIYDDDLSDEVNQIKLGGFVQDELIACVLLKPLDKHTLKLRQMAVASNWQQKGVGRQMVQAAEHYARTNNFLRIELHARLSAQDFYKQLAYLVTNEEIFIEVGIEHVAMCKEL